MDMKNIIFNYYNIYVDNPIVNNDNVSFNYKGFDYLLIPFEQDLSVLKNIVNMDSELIKMGFLCHQIINNKYGNFLSSFNKKNYILLRILKKKTDQVGLLDIIGFQKKYIINSKLKDPTKNWGDMWQKKIDYLEEQMKAFCHSKNIIINSFSYYIGLGENAIQYYNKIDNSIMKKSVLSHRRIFYPNYWINYANPLSFIIDIPERDLAELIKSEFFFGKMNEAYEDASFIIKTKKMSKNSFEMFIARLMYPTYYFDLFEKALLNEDYEDKIISIIERIGYYELFLKRCFNMINNLVEINPIPGWIL